MLGCANSGRMRFEGISGLFSEMTCMGDMLVLALELLAVMVQAAFVRTGDLDPWRCRRRVGVSGDAVGEASVAQGGGGT